MKENSGFGVTVVVGTLQRGSYVLTCVRDLLAQTYRPLEILIIDQSPEADPVTHEELTSLVAEHSALITYHTTEPLGIPAVRNYGWRHARYDAILFVDDDIRCGPDLVGEHVRALCLPGVGFVAGAIEEPRRPAETKDTGRFNRWTATPLGGFAAHGEKDVDHGRGCNFSAWRQALEHAGGVDEILNIGAGLYEETELALRLRRVGYRVYFNGKARLVHLEANNGGCRVKDIQKYIRGLSHNRAILIRRHIRWYQFPIALARMAALAAAYAWHYRKPCLLSTGARSFVAGWRAAGQSRLRALT
jgi:GT2 family glycosyltransferase